MPTPQNPEREPSSRPAKESHTPLTALTNTLSDLRKTPTFRFFGLAFLAYVVWSVAYEQVLKPQTTLDEVVIEHMVNSTESAFKAIGWPVGTYPQPATHRDRVGVAGHAGVQIGAPCDGVALFALFAIFILAFPGPLLRKLWFIPQASPCCTSPTSSASSILARIQATSPEWLEFNHDYTFTVLIYGLVFALWYLWTAMGRKTPQARRHDLREPPQPAPELRKPWWLVVLGAMLGFGLLQEQSKIKVNHYLRVGDVQQFWDDDAPTRTTWWDAHAPVGRHNFYVSRSTWPLFHGLTRSQLVTFKWGLSAAILLIFFVLDVLFLRAHGRAGARAVACPHLRHGRHPDGGPGLLEPG